MKLIEKILKKLEVVFNFCAKYQFVFYGFMLGLVTGLALG